MAEQNAINNVQEWLQQQYTGGGLGMWRRTIQQDLDYYEFIKELVFLGAFFFVWFGVWTQGLGPVYAKHAFYY
jgi:hypothetical protein